MTKKVTAKDVAEQVALALEYFLKWMEQRDENRNSVIAENKPKRETDEDSLLTAAEVSEILSISEAFTYRLMQQNKSL